eukprot:TRINITY_DN2754_c0_g1_i6.p1 TRINITY_DN2754_c0_g1~~TRINITY_DN2754_c0_g1_i6.p1  ORF type:complete len:116 (-),score=32.16 TRINITY_DN2754_c0_g1_i6:232-579(-)
MSDLAWAVKNGDLDQVKEMVEVKGVDINQQIDGRLPLHYASDYGQLEVLKFLCQKVRNLTKKQNRGPNIFITSGSSVELSRQARHIPPPSGHLGGPHQLCTVPAREGSLQVWHCS